MTRRKAQGPLIWIRFTGAAGGTIYNYKDGEKTLKVGDSVAVLGEVSGHWLALLESGDAELVEE